MSGNQAESSLGHLKQRAGSEEFCAFVLKETGKVIGNIYCENRDFNAKEIGCIINKHCQRKGYAREALQAVVDHAFSFGIHRVFAECDPRNVIRNTWAGWRSNAY